MNWKRLLYRLMQVIGWLGAVYAALPSFVIVTDYLRDGLCAEASIYPPNAGWKVLVAVIPPLALVTCFLWVIHLKKIRHWFFDDRAHN
jgi:hypothetical protein